MKTDKEETSAEIRSVTDKALSIAQVALAFGEVERATQHQDGRPETDTTHTVMLALLAIEFATPDLDPGLLAQFAIIHDLPEFEALDTNTARGLTPIQAEEKRRRESEAIDTLRGLGLRRIVELLDVYERQACPEARWIRYVDKITPKLTHLLNRGAAVRAIGMTGPEMRSKHIQQGARLASEYPEQKGASELFEAVCERCERELEGVIATTSVEGRREPLAAEEDFELEVSIDSLWEVITHLSLIDTPTPGKNWWSTKARELMVHALSRGLELAKNLGVEGDAHVEDDEAPDVEDDATPGEPAARIAGMLGRALGRALWIDETEAKPEGTCSRPTPARPPVEAELDGEVVRNLAASASLERLAIDYYDEARAEVRALTSKIEQLTSKIEQLKAELAEEAGAHRATSRDFEAEAERWADAHAKLVEQLEAETTDDVVSPPKAHEVEDALEVVRRHAADRNAREGTYYGAFPPTAEEREELIELFASTLREVKEVKEANPGEVDAHAKLGRGSP